MDVLSCPATFNQPARAVCEDEPPISVRKDMHKKPVALHYLLLRFAHVPKSTQKKRTTNGTYNGRRCWNPIFVELAARDTKLRPSRSERKFRKNQKVERIRRFDIMKASQKKKAEVLVPQLVQRTPHLALRFRASRDENKYPSNPPAIYEILSRLLQ